MKFGIFASLLIAGTLLMGCSGMKTPKAKMVDHDVDHDLPAIDHTIINMKRDYIKNCYMPVANREPPENSCQTELFQMLERRYHSDYSQRQVDMAANDLFFKDVDKEIRRLAKSDPEVRRSLRNGTFGSINDMIAYYRDAYKFDTK